MNEENGDDHLFHLLQQKRPEDHLGNQYLMIIEELSTITFVKSFNRRSKKD